MVITHKSNSNELLDLFGRDFDSFSTCIGLAYTNNVSYFQNNQVFGTGISLTCMK